MRHTLAPALLLALLPASAGAVLSDLGPGEVEEAVSHGRAVYEAWRTERRPIDDVEPGYVVDLGPEIGRALLFTEFSAVALETRRWLAIARAPGPEDIEHILAPLRGRLRFAVTLVGDRRDLLRHYTVRLVQGDRSVEPASWDVFKASPVPGRGRFVAPAQYFFAVTDLDLSRPVVLVFSEPAGGVVRFEFDLGRLR